MTFLHQFTSYLYIAMSTSIRGADCHFVHMRARQDASMFVASEQSEKKRHIIFYNLYQHILSYVKNKNLLYH